MPRALIGLQQAFGPCRALLSHCGMAIPMPDLAAVVLASEGRTSLCP
ncbi:hypothetical protein [Novosphingobium sp. SG707]|nr:hypothetical protein [Novosphingobium sp. SG707]NKJ02727.1 hypothetical protein [Novosphingobium sp. SG707]